MTMPINATEALAVFYVSGESCVTMPMPPKVSPHLHEQFWHSLNANAIAAKALDVFYLCVCGEC